MGVERVVSETVSRIRCLRALEAAVVFAIAGLGAAAVVLLSIKWAGPVSNPDLWLELAALFPVVGALIGWFRPLSRLRAARLLDRSYRLHDRISSALCFGRLPPAERTAFMDACIADATERAPLLQPSAVAPLRASRRWMALVVAALSVAALAAVEPPEKRHSITPRKPLAALLQPDDIESLERDIEQAGPAGYDGQRVREGLEAFNQLVRAIADSKLTFPDAVRRIGELDERMRESHPAHLDEVEQELRLTGKRLGRQSPARPLSEALRGADAARARRELDRLARDLQSGQKRSAGLQRLRRALQRGGDRDGDQQSRPVSRRREALRSTLRQNGLDGVRASKNEPFSRRTSKARALQRELQGLDRGERELERLSRHLNDAAGALAQRDSEGAARELRGAGQRLGRIAGEQREARALERLRGRLAELRDTLRWQQQRKSRDRAAGGAGDDGGDALGLERFARLARGQGRAGGAEQKREGDARGAPVNRDGDSAQRPEQRVPSLRMRAAREPSRAAGGSAAGSGTGSERLERPSQASVSHRDSSVEGEQGAGPVRSEVIPQSADQGFASKAYRGVYSDYRNHAESVLETDVVPPGYRFYVKRYFRLIRPR